MFEMDNNLTILRNFNNQYNVESVKIKKKNKAKELLFNKKHQDFENNKMPKKVRKVNYIDSMFKERKENNHMDICHDLPIKDNQTPEEVKNLLINLGRIDKVEEKIENNEKIGPIINEPIKPIDDTNFLKLLNNNEIVKKAGIVVLNRIYTGNFSRVYMCKIQKFGERMFVAKLFNKNNKQSIQDFKKQCESEYILQKNCGLVSKQHINQLFGFFEVDVESYGLVYFHISEYEINKDLRYFKSKKLRMKRFAEPLVTYFAGQLLHGLKCIHSLNITHLDIKLDNLFLNGFYNLKIGDFTIAMSYDSENKMRFPTSGTKLYMSPERLEKLEIEYENIHKLDLWSVGVVLYQLLYNKFPFELENKDDVSAVKNKLQFNLLVFDDEVCVSIYMKDFLSKLLDKDIKTRMSSYEAFNHPILQNYQNIIQLKEYYAAGNYDKFLINLHKGIY